MRKNIFTKIIMEKGEKICEEKTKKLYYMLFKKS